MPDEDRPLVTCYATCRICQPAAAAREKNDPAGAALVDLRRNANRAAGRGYNVQLQLVPLQDPRGEPEGTIRRELPSGRGGAELYSIKHARLENGTRKPRRRRSSGFFRRQRHRRVLVVGVHETGNGISESSGSFRVEGAGEGSDRGQVYRDTFVCG